MIIGGEWAQSDRRSAVSSSTVRRRRMGSRAGQAGSGGEDMATLGATVREQSDGEGESERERGLTQALPEKRRGRAREEILKRRCGLRPTREKPERSWSMRLMPAVSWSWQPGYGDSHHGSHSGSHDPHVGMACHRYQSWPPCRQQIIDECLLIWSASLSCLCCNDWRPSA